MSETLIMPGAAAQMAGCSKTSIRNYLKNPVYAKLFSQHARGNPRLFTIDDVRLLRLITQSTAQGQTHEQIATAVNDGALEDLDWQPPEVEELAGPEENVAGKHEEAAMVLTQQFQQALVQFQQANNALTAQLGEARANEQQLMAELKSAHRQIGELGEIQANEQQLMAELKAAHRQLGELGEIQANEEHLLSRLEEAQRKIGELEAALKNPRAPFWRRLLGGE